MVVSDAWPTAPCHRSVTRTTTGLLTRHGHARLCCRHFHSRLRGTVHLSCTRYWHGVRWQLEYPRQLPSPPCTVVILLTRRVSSTLTTLHSMPTPPTSSSTTTGPGGVQTSATSSNRRFVCVDQLAVYHFQ